jgi:catechol 2,3-dioxygenase-like lactoylglutathione lyase family enzyme
MPISVRFYRDLLGFELIDSAPARSPDDFDWCWLRLNGAELMLNTAYESDRRPSRPSPARIAAHDDTCFYLGCPDIDAAFRYLRDSGLPINEPKIAHYGMKQIYFKDPDGYNLCLQCKA